MLKVHNIVSHFLSHSLFTSALKNILLPALILVLAACSENKSDGHQETPTSKNYVSGNAVKGVITNGIVSAYLVESNEVNTSNSARKLLGQTRTNSAGEYVINIPTLEYDPIIVLELTADSQTTMRCDLVDGCLYPENTNTSNILLAEFGSELPLPKNFKLLGYKQGESQLNAFISPLSHIIYTTANSLPGGLSSSNLETASGWVAQTFNLNVDLISTKTPDLTALSDLHDLTDQQLRQGVLSSAFYSLTMTDTWSRGEFDLNTLPLKEIFLDAAYSAETLSEQLSIEQNGYSEALFAINTENQVQAQIFENQQLTILQQPNSLTVNEGNSFVLHVQASGDTPISYQWKKNNQNIYGANSASYGIASTHLSDAGSYSVTVSHNGESLTSLNALVTVSQAIEPVSIIEQPQNLNLTAGDPITLSISVSGDSPYSYQWQKGGAILLGETNSTLHIVESSQTNSGTYRVTVNNSINEVSSDFVSVIVNDSIAPVTINQQPQNLTITEGETASFQINASGGGFISYQWRKNSVNIANAYTSQIEINNADISNTGDYDVVVSNSRGSITSNLAKLTILSSETPVSITLQPISKNIVIAEEIHLRTAATGDGILNYQWLFNGQEISGANLAEYSVDSATFAHQGSYSVRVNNRHSTEESLSAFVAVIPKPSVQLSWDIPSFREDDSPLDMSEISGYLLEYGYSPSAITGHIRLTDANITQYTITDLASGMLYAHISTIDSTDVQGQFSDWISVTIE